MKQLLSNHRIMNIDQIVLQFHQNENKSLQEAMERAALEFQEKTIRYKSQQNIQVELQE